jgi:hypothetical protein
LVEGVQPVASGYHVLWEALRHYKERLEKMASMTTDEDQQFKHDEKVQDIDGLLASIRLAAKDDYQLEPWR